MDDSLQISDLSSLNHSLSELTSFHSLGKWLELLISLIVFFPIMVKKCMKSDLIIGQAGSQSVSQSTKYIPRALFFKIWLRIK